MELTKVCSVCGRDKPLSEFRKQEGKKFGVRYQCKLCQDDIETARHKLKALKAKFPDYEKYKVVLSRDDVDFGKYRLLGDCPLCGADLLIELTPSLELKEQCVECNHLIFG
jgi:hypothetical protein